MPAKKSAKRLKRAARKAKRNPPPSLSMRRMVLERMAFLTAAAIMAAGILAISPLSLLGKYYTHPPVDFPAPAAVTAPVAPPKPLPFHPPAPAVLAPGSATAKAIPPAPFVRAYIVPDVKYPQPQPGQPAPLIWRIPTDQPVVFLTLDDGIIKDPRAITFMQEHHLVASLFLSNALIDGHYAYFQKFVSNGSLVENHTLNHPFDLHKKSREVQKAEICGASDIYAKVFGRRPVLYRPPGGNYSPETQHAVADCGMKAVVMWHAKVDGGEMQWQDGNRLLPGDIVLMHFRPGIIEDLTAFTKAVNEANLRVALLEDWFE